MKTFSYLYIFFFVTVTAQTNGIRSSDFAFTLLDSVSRSDINYRDLSNLMTVSGGKPMIDSVFTVTAGKYNVYRYIASDIGYPCAECDFLDTLYWIVILKTNNKGIMKDAYCYFLSQSEMPRTWYLYRAKRRKIPFKSGITLRKFDFENRKSPEMENCTIEEYLKPLKLYRKNPE